MAGKKTIGNCPVQEKINEYCSCPKTECERHGICCECIVEHKNREGVAIVDPNVKTVFCLI